MSSSDETPDSLGVTLEVLEEGFVDLRSLDCHLLVDLGREGGHERLENSRQKLHGLDACVHDLLASGGVALSEHPWLRLLHVSIAETGVGHGDSQGVLELNFLHKLKELLKLSIQRLDKFLVLRVLGTLISWHLTLKAARQELQASVGEVTKILEELVVVFCNKVGPEEDRVLLLWPV